MSATDPAVTAAAEALCTPIRLHTWVVQERPCELCVLDAQDMLRAARPVVENEVRTSIRRRYETNTCGCGHDRACHNSRDLGDCTDCPHGTCLAPYNAGLLWDRRHGLRDEAEVRERIAADIEAEARQVLTDDGAGQVERAALLDAARIARGQS